MFKPRLQRALIMKWGYYETSDAVFLSGYSVMDNRGCTYRDAYLNGQVACIPWLDFRIRLLQVCASPSEKGQPLCHCRTGPSCDGIQANAHRECSFSDTLCTVGNNNLMGSIS